MAAWLSPEQRENIKKQLIIDEGVVYKIYVDSLGFRTFGIGHLIKPTDPEYKLPTGQAVSEARVNAVFQVDLNDAIGSTQRMLPNCTTWPNEVQEIIVNMTFNLGGKMLKFTNMVAALNGRDWQRAADEMQNSRWYTQVGVRAQRLVARMRNVHDK